MFTVSKLARQCGLSRTALLYYESIGLLEPASRSAGNYRRYSEKELRRLQEVCAYRDAGLKLDDIRAILGRPRDEAAAVLRRRLLELNGEIETLRLHQRAILRLLQNRKSFTRAKRMTKEKWVA